MNLSVERGEIHAICGENGAGKSTLMNVLSGVRPGVPQARRAGRRPGIGTRVDRLVLDRSRQTGLHPMLLGLHRRDRTSIIIRAFAEWVLERPTRAERRAMERAAASTFNSHL